MSDASTITQCPLCELSLDAPTTLELSPPFVDSAPKRLAWHLLVWHGSPANFKSGTIGQQVERGVPFISVSMIIEAARQISEGKYEPDVDEALENVKKNDYRMAVEACKCFCGHGPIDLTPSGLTAYMHHLVEAVGPERAFTAAGVKQHFVMAEIEKR